MEAFASATAIACGTQVVTQVLVDSPNSVSPLLGDPRQLPSVFTCPASMQLDDDVTTDGSSSSPSNLGFNEEDWYENNGRRRHLLADHRTSFHHHAHTLGASRRSAREEEAEGPIVGHAKQQRPRAVRMLQEEPATDLDNNGFDFISRTWGGSATGGDGQTGTASNSGTVFLPHVYSVQALCCPAAPELPISQRKTAQVHLAVMNGHGTPIAECAAITAAVLAGLQSAGLAASLLPAAADPASISCEGSPTEGALITFTLLGDASAQDWLAHMQGRGASVLVRDAGLPCGTIVRAALTPTLGIPTSVLVDPATSQRAVFGCPADTSATRSDTANLASQGYLIVDVSELCCLAGLDLEVDGQGGWECVTYTTLDRVRLAVLGAGEEDVCEAHPGAVFTPGSWSDGQFTGCECACCQPRPAAEAPTTLYECVQEDAFWQWVSRQFEKEAGYACTQSGGEWGVYECGCDCCRAVQPLRRSLKGGRRLKA